jgi:hypothetical protein
LDLAYHIVGDACWRCGYGRGKAGRRLLDFHHVDRDRKLFNLDARAVTNLSWDRVLGEMMKCVVLCANCHRECEAGLIPADEIEVLHAARWRQAMPVVRELEQSGKVRWRRRSNEPAEATK